MATKHSHIILISAVFISLALSVFALVLGGNNSSYDRNAEDIQLLSQDLRDIREEMGQVQRNLGCMGTVIARLENKIRFQSYTAPADTVNSISETDIPPDSGNQDDAFLSEFIDTMTAEESAPVESEMQRTSLPDVDDLPPSRAQKNISAEKKTEIKEKVEEVIEEKAEEIIKETQSSVTPVQESRFIEPAASHVSEQSTEPVSEKQESEKTEPKIKKVSSPAAKRQTVVFRDTSKGTEVREIVPVKAEEKEETTKKSTEETDGISTNKELFIDVADLLTTGASTRAASQTNAPPARVEKRKPVTIPQQVKEESPIKPTQEPPTIKVPVSEEKRTERTQRRTATGADPTLPGATPQPRTSATAPASTRTSTTTPQTQVTPTEATTNAREIRSAEEKLIAPARVTSVPARTDVPEVEEKPVRRSRLSRTRQTEDTSPAFISVSDTLIRRENAGEKKTMSDILEEHARSGENK